MLSAEKNEPLTRVGPGTRMGELLRRYRWPVANHDRATRVPVKRRLLGEDLVLYRPDGGAPPQPEIPGYEVPLKDERGEWLRDYVDGQDIVAPAYVQEYRVAADRHVVCWCAACDLMCTVVVGALVGTEPDH